MANLGFFEIDTQGEYVDLETATELTFTEGTKYTMQVQNASSYLTLCVSDSTPTEGGFMMKDLEKFDYTPVSGYTLYVNTLRPGKVYLNIAS